MAPLKASFYLPVILPPLKDASDPAGYYDEIETSGGRVTAATVGGERSLEITILYAETSHPSEQFDNPLPISTVFSPTSGYVRYYPSTAVLPTPDALPAEPPGDLITDEIGSLVIRVWISDYRDLIKTSSPQARRTNRIVLSWLQKSHVEAAFKAEISRLGTAVLESSWKNAGGTGAIPGQEELKEAFLQRFLAGDAEIFVDAGAVLGAGALVMSSTVPAPSEVAQVKMQAFFVAENPADSQFVPVDELLENVISELRPANRALFTGHPLLGAADEEIEVYFRSTFLIWDNTIFDYVAFPHGTVMLMKEEEGEVARTTTDSQGSIELLVETLKRRDSIYFEYETFQQTFGNRYFEENIRTESHRAWHYVDEEGENTETYVAKYVAHPAYVKFIYQLAENEDDEPFEEDRGNVQRREGPPGPLLPRERLRAAAYEALPSYTQTDFLEHVELAENYYRKHGFQSGPQTFNVIVEGDSWLNYPIASNDIYSHLDETLKKKTSEGIRYNRFPLQHFGDRTDQMFGPGTGEKRQIGFLADILAEYKIDLIVCSGGGNDLAESGISNRLPEWTSILLEPYQACFGTGSYFDPYQEQGLLDVDQRAVAKRLRELSFAILLKNHAWNLFKYGHPIANQTNDETTYKDLDSMVAKLEAELGTNFGERNLAKQAKVLEDIAQRVLVGVGKEPVFPNLGGNALEKLLAGVFDPALFKPRFDDVKSRWEILLDVAVQLNIPVITHTYCYPLFRDDPTTFTGGGKSKGYTGPWFYPRFMEAKIQDRRVQMICLKKLIDNYAEYILADLKARGEYQGIFDYADLRHLNQTKSRWRDEIHLDKDGFKMVADEIFKTIAAHPLLQQFFE